MKTITVNASKTYDVKIGPGILDEAGLVIQNICGGQTAAVVTDDNVDALYAKRLAGTLEKNGYRVVKYVFAHGETSKNTDTFISVLNFFAKEKLSRTDLVIALGGGVAGDLAGFAASCYMRGINFVQIPTTLLAMVDSSVGGKTAVNLNAGKNLAGAFYQPEVVICDVSLLTSLPEEFYRDGLAEIIKYGVILDKALFESLKKPVSKQLEEVIARCVEIKRDVVAKDEFERGMRKLLNFGHTIGHAIEQSDNFQISHGRAVAIGMAVEARAAFKMGICDAGCLRDILDMICLHELPHSTNCGAGKLARACLSDKKRGGGSLTMIFPAEIGKCVLKEIPVMDLEAVIGLGLGDM